MHTILFIPGIMGTRLKLGNEEIWPPEPGEVVTGYKRIDKLMDPAAKAGKIIDTVGKCFDFYGTLFKYFDGMGYKEGDPAKRLVLFPYDWRQDLHETAKLLAQALEAAAATADRITLVAHSMGGLISRLALEAHPENHGTWLAKTDMFIALAVPQRGAPLALARVLGLDSATGISASDFKKLASNPAFPSGYQLLPAPGEHCFYDESGSNLKSMDIYDQAVATKFALSQPLLAKAKSVHTAFATGTKPANVRYFQFGGIGLDTVTRVSWLGGVGTEFKVRKTKSDGDGTVPNISAVNPAHEWLKVVNEHAHIFLGTPFQSAFFRLFGINIGPLLAGVKGKPKAVISVAAPVIPAGQGFSVAIALDQEVETLKGNLVLTKLDDKGKPDAAGQAISAILYDGEATDYVTTSVRGIAVAGIYRLSFTGSANTEFTATFAVTTA